MKKTIKLMEALQEHMEQQISEREETFENRSEKWQESEKGEAYNELTGRLQEMLDEVTDWAIELGE